MMAMVARAVKRKIRDWWGDGSVGVMPRLDNNDVNPCIGGTICPTSLVIVPAPPPDNKSNRCLPTNAATIIKSGVIISAAMRMIV